ncbi:MAG: ABC transporter substrate-binding protein [Bacteroidales bacterium]|nr:ABC transporter substrate-binding protein [Bacteroidales bacterium]
MLDLFIDTYRQESGLQIDYELKAASMGLDWLKEELAPQPEPEALSDLFISAGFDLFFDDALMGHYKKQGVFKDLTGLNKLNPDFDDTSIDLKDPKGHYSMLAVAFGRIFDKQPRAWRTGGSAHLERPAKPEFENSVSLPIGDFDLFNAILLTMYKYYGEEAVAQLGRTLLQSMHPAEMVRSNVKNIQRPAITIMPYFFTKTVKEGSPMQAVWPEDGAIISPIFMLYQAGQRAAT